MNNKIYLVLLGLLGIILYGLTLKGVAGNPVSDKTLGKLDKSTMPFELSPERGRYLLTYSIAENHSFALTNELAKAASPDIGYREGKFYVFFPPGISLLAVPFYELGKVYDLAQLATFSVISVFAIFDIWLIFLISRWVYRLPGWTAALASMIYAFGSSSWSYAVTLYQHQVSTFLILSAFLSVWKYKQNKKYGWVWAAWVGIAYGLGIWIDYPNALLMLPIIGYLVLCSSEIKHIRNSFHLSIKPAVIIALSVMLLIIVTHGYYNHVNFGSWKRLSGSLPHYEVQDVEKEQKSNPDYKIKTTEAEKNPVKFFREENLPFGIYTLISSVDRGVLLYSPIFLLAVFGILRSVRRMNLEMGVLLGVVAVNLFLYSSWGDPWGGWAFGPRYLIPSLSILAIFVAYWLYNLKYQVAARITVMGLFAYSAAIALLGVLTTNAVPPKIEGDYLKMKYNFLLNIDYLRAGRSSSFVFNNAVSDWLTLDQYFVIIYCAVLFVFGLLLWLPRKKKAYDN